MKKFFMKIGLLIFSLVVAMVIMELILRISVREEGKRSVKYDEDLGWAGIPFAEGVYFYKEDNLHARYKFNELGFRDELISSLPDSSTRLLLLGDSFVESLEVDYDSTFHRRVEYMIKTGINRNIDVINVSSQNYGTSQQIIALDKYKNIIRPNIVILVFYSGNDFEDNTRPRFASIDQEGRLQWNNQRDSWLEIKYKSLISWLYDKSHLIYFLRNYIQNNFYLEIFSNRAAMDKVKGSNDYGYKITKLLLLNLTEKLQTMKIPFGVVIIPHKDEVIRQDPAKANFVEQVCGTYHIPCLNFYGKLKPEHYLKVDEHFNVDGHRVVSDTLYNFLVARFFSNNSLQKNM